MCSTRLIEAGLAGDFDVTQGSVVLLDEGTRGLEQLLDGHL
jgi:hypothetical protein